MRRVVLLGDIGGQIGAFRRALSTLQIDPDSPRVPADTLLIQVGDLVRCTPALRTGNFECVALAEELLRRSGDDYVQLFGNHESAALGGPRRSSWEPSAAFDKATTQSLLRLWSDRSVRLAVAVETIELGEILVTHAGLTRARWSALGKPGSPRVAARLLNGDVGASMAQVSHAGALVDRPADERADVMWAEVNLELYEPWIAARDAPFSQVHGHASPFDWQRGTWWPETPNPVRQLTNVQHDVRRTTTTLGPLEHQWAQSIDWALGDTVVDDVWPLLTASLRSST